MTFLPQWMTNGVAIQLRLIAKIAAKYLNTLNYSIVTKTPARGRGFSLIQNFVSEIRYCEPKW
jgi:hypothetical protein